MTRALSLFFLGVLAAGVSGCTASRPPPYALPDADKIVADGSYTVGRNENIYAIAQKQGVKMRELIALNGLKPPFALKTGQTLALPSKDPFAAPTPRAAPLDPIDKGMTAPAPLGGFGGTNGVTAEELKPIELPAPPSPPPPMAIQNQEPTLTATPARSPLPDAASSLKNVSTGAKVREPTEVPPTMAEQPETAPAPPPAQESASDKTLVFGWPVRGTVISAFGPKSKGLDNDGINIAAPKGAPVKAAAPGIVAYAGNEMKGFGNLVLIRHEGGWVTAYAHLDRLVVARDAVVAKGDMIGTIGSSGGVASPQLHFETRQEGRPVDPELVIR